MLPGGQFEGRGQYVVVFPPSQKDWPEAVRGRKWMGDAERAAMTVKAAGCSAPLGREVGTAAASRGSREEARASFIVVDSFLVDFLEVKIKVEIKVES